MGSRIMGGISSKIEAKAASVKAEVKQEMMHNMQLSMEVQKAVGIAQMRDMLQWYGGLYSAIVTAITIKAITPGPKVPHVAAIPVVMGGFMLCNIADAAYGNKMVRVRKEAEHLIANERHLFVPPRQAPFIGCYSDEERALKEEVSAVGCLWPSFLPMYRAK